MHPQSKTIGIQTSKRDQRTIRAWMAQHGITGVFLAAESGVSSALVSATITGKRNNRKVLRHLVSMGCPSALLALPEDMVVADHPGKTNFALC